MRPASDVRLSLEPRDKEADTGSTGTSGKFSRSWVSQAFHKEKRRTMSGRAYIRSAGVAVAATFALVMGAPIAAAAPCGHAICLGIEASAISPPGSSEEFPGGLPDVVRFVKSLEGKFGPAPSQFAHIHAGSHEACDAAVGG